MEMKKPGKACDGNIKVVERGPQSSSSSSASSSRSTEGFPVVPSPSPSADNMNEKVSSSKLLLCKEIYWSVIASLSFLSTGLIRAYTSPALLSMQNEVGGNGTSSNGYSIQNTSSLLASVPPSSKNDVISWIASITTLASFFGSISSGPCLYQLGRRQTLFILTLPCILGWILIGYASSVRMVLIGRALTGFSAGIATAAVPLYITEVVCQSRTYYHPQQGSPRKGKNWLGLLPGILLAAGIVLEFVLAHEFQWRELALVNSIFPFILCLLTLTIPESSIWLEGKKKLEKSPKWDLEMTEVVPSPTKKGHPKTKNKQQETNLSENSSLILKSKRSGFASFLRLVLPISLLMIFQQFSGGNALIYYLSEILTKNSATSCSTLGLTGGPQTPDPISIHRASLIIGVVQFVGFILALPLIDRIGHRKLLITSALSMFLIHLALGFHFHSTHYCKSHLFGGNDSWGFTVRVTLLSVLFSCYSIGLGPIPFLFIQIFSRIHRDMDDSGALAQDDHSARKHNKSRSYISSVASLVNHVALFTTVKGFPFLFHMEYGPEKTFFGMAGVCWIAFLFVVVFVPESSTTTLTSSPSIPDSSASTSSTIETSSSNSCQMIKSSSKGTK